MFLPEPPQHAGASLVLRKNLSNPVYAVESPGKGRLFIFLVILQRRVLIAVVASDPIATIWRPIEGHCDSRWTVLWKILSCPLHVALMLLGPATGDHALAPLLSHVIFRPLPLCSLYVLLLLFQLLAVVRVHAVEGRRSQIGDLSWHFLKIAFAVICWLAIQPCLAAERSFFSLFLSCILGLLPSASVLNLHVVGVAAEQFLQKFLHGVHVLAAGPDEFVSGFHRHSFPPGHDQCFSQ